MSMLAPLKPAVSGDHERSRRANDDKKRRRSFVQIPRGSKKQARGSVERFGVLGES
ncbi:uncharacterized protein G2W53_016221 [Senna tora]|uniref:Uncharacterized protein n=1 Tax=Senna tora TaxID=362788 RepID=A0A834TPF7_9FABA|nr:uncharacterized protein G2W53_016221 [Senna tora]